ncbi:MAG: YhbY family RNA-binding protein [Tissierellia bacterium]|nr:YhbY family RNA-binding protein [Tissierellia bacterium]
MITGRQRSYLKSLANTLKPSLNIGKNGLSQSVLDQLEIQLEHEELVKITVINNSPVEAKDIVDEILEKTQGEFVSQLGNKMVIYRKSKENPKIDLP